MGPSFFTSPQASEITGCSKRQLQYWRESEIIVPTVNSTGRGHTVYYSANDLLSLTLMEYLISLGLTFDFCQRVLGLLKKKEPDLLEMNSFRMKSITKSFMLLLVPGEGRYITQPARFEERDITLQPLAECEFNEAVYLTWAIFPLRFPEVYGRLRMNFRRLGLDIFEALPKSGSNG